MNCMADKLTHNKLPFASELHMDDAKRGIGNIVCAEGHYVAKVAGDGNLQLLLEAVNSPAELQEEVTRLREALEGLVIAYYYDNGGCPAIVKARQALAPKEK